MKDQPALQSVYGDAGLAASEMLGSQRRVRIGEGVALAERAIQFVQRGRAEGAIHRSVPGNVGIDLVAQSGARAEGVLRAIGEFDVGGHSGTNGYAYGRRVVIAPVVYAAAERKKPTRSDLDQVFAKKTHGALAPAGGLIRRRNTRGELDIVAGADFFVVVETGDDRLPFSNLLGPDGGTADALGRNGLQIRLGFGVTSGDHRRDRRKSLMVGLNVGVEPQR